MGVGGLRKAAYPPPATLPGLQSPAPDDESVTLPHHPYSQPHLLAPPAPWGTRLG